jgi:hypothetical protein
VGTTRFAGSRCEYAAVVVNCCSRLRDLDGNPQAFSHEKKTPTIGALGWGVLALAVLIVSALVVALRRGPSRGRGATGPASSRDYDPDNCGGPIRHLSADRIRFTGRGIDVVAKHVARFGPFAPNEGMLVRLRAIQAGAMEPTSSDRNFYSHELREFVRYRRLGYLTGRGDDRMVWNNAHTAALEDYRLAYGPGVLYHPTVEEP